MWLRIIYGTLNNDLVNFEPDKIEVQVIESNVAPVGEEWKDVRLSPMFPLLVSGEVLKIENQTLHFFSFKNAYRALARINQIGSESLKKSTYFSLGLASVILISSNAKLHDELRSVVDVSAEMYEIWTIKDGKINSIN